jgi:hypothetical protein
MYESEQASEFRRIGEAADVTHARVVCDGHLDQPQQPPGAIGQDVEAAAACATALHQRPRSPLARRRSAGMDGGDRPRRIDGWYAAAYAVSPIGDRILCAVSDGFLGFQASVEQNAAIERTLTPLQTSDGKAGLARLDTRSRIRAGPASPGWIGAAD